ncbi:hypothetical protein TNCV_3752811 [Trichonephila clavipes]|nr:hypothetical protein TNCV_3752811 [Trichonephila clavipes]
MRGRLTVHHPPLHGRVFRVTGLELIHAGKESVTLTTRLPWVELLTSTPKHSSHHKLLRQLALEVINGIPDKAIFIYADGSRSDTGRAGGGIFSNTPGSQTWSEETSVFTVDTSHMAVSGNKVADELADIGVVISITPVPQS